jgi:hypothetical protein
MTEEEEFNNPDYNNPNSVNYHVDKSFTKSNEDNFPYLGNFREKQRRNGDSFFTGWVCMDEIEKIPEEYIKLRADGKKYVKFVLNKYLKGVNEHGETHSFAVDTFTFNKKEEE